MPKYSREKIRTLPQPALDNFYSLEVNDRYSQEIFPLLDDGEEEKLQDLMFDVYFRVVTPGAFLATLADFIKEEDRRKKIAANMLGLVFLPIADYLEADITKLIEQVGGDPNLFKKKVAVSDAVAQVKKKAAVTLPTEERLAKRIDAIIASRVMEVRKDEQARELLLGPTKTSGAGLDEATAQKLLFFVNEELTTLRQRGIDIVPDDQLRSEEAALPPVAAPVIGGGPSGPPVSPPTGRPEGRPPEGLPAKKPESLTFSADDLKEIENIAKKVPPAEGGADAIAAGAALLDGIVDESVAITKVNFSDQDLQKRYSTAVSLYFRDLRDVMETRAKLMLSIPQGGLGFSAADTDRIMSALAAKAGEYRELTSSHAAAGKKLYVELQTKKVLTAEEEMVKREQEELERRFAELTVGSKKSSPVPPVPGTKGTGEIASPKMIPVVVVARSTSPVPKVPGTEPPMNLPLAP